MKKPIPTRDNMTPADLFRSMIPTCSVRLSRAHRLVTLVEHALIHSEDPGDQGEMFRESLIEALAEAREDLDWLQWVNTPDAPAPSSDERTLLVALGGAQ